ncbi:MAG TPA: polyamine aminopropyltransferase [Casimicrobiaceae bacterium]|nr:polyamine aminopropyltransferase [Casimicrobiaceae bacterium]
MTGSAPPGDFAPGVMIEYMTDDWGMFVRSAGTLARFRSAYQDVEVHDSVPFGKLFRLDGHFMTSERDEFFYHENMIHVAALAHPGPERALIVGGGDGGSAEELLKYPSVRAVTIAEIDQTVIDISREHLQAVHRGALDDPRVTIRIGDGFRFVMDTRDAFDLVVLDLTDPGGPSTALYTPEFYAACAARLGPQGAMTMHVGSPVAHPDRVRETLAELRRAFAVVAPFMTAVPLYGGSWMMACCSASLDPRVLQTSDVDLRIAQRGIGDLQFINGDTYRAVLALPNYVRPLAR